eukprot:c15043_g1_i1.p1 GENE.c15043_g1_i1~~c15043_g1_i1.p1  ORF type:complete len:268 (-),score=4.19 c15043_g1_i1:12-815(-)
MILLEHVDIYAIGHVVLVSLSSTFEEWKAACDARHEKLQPTQKRFRTNKLLVDIILNSELIDSFVNDIDEGPEAWVKFALENLVTHRSANTEQRPLFIHSDHSREKHHFLRLLWPWIRLMRSPELEFKNSTTRGLGIFARKFILTGKKISCLTGMHSRTSVASMNRPTREGKRLSFASISSSRQNGIQFNAYIGGPISILNISCPSHSNVCADFTTSIVKTLTDIEKGEELLISYGSDPVIRNRVTTCGVLDRINGELRPCEWKFPV